MNEYTDLSYLSKEDSYSVALTLLGILKDDPSYSMISELPYLLDQANFLELLKYYEGKTIRIPTMDEVKRAMRVILSYQYYLIEKYEWHEALRLAGYDPETEGRSAERYLHNFIEVLAKYKIGDRIYGKQSN